MGRGGVKKRLILLYFFKRRLKNRLFYSKIYCFKNFAGSANGRPRDSESRYFGSNPNPAATKSGYATSWRANLSEPNGERGNTELSKANVGGAERIVWVRGK